MSRLVDRKVVIGNWKMNGSQGFNHGLVKELIRLESTIENSAEIVICPPLCYLSQCQELLLFSKKIRLGAQTCSEFEEGAFTGEVSINMLKDFNCHYVLVGHSERRSIMGETNEIIAKKCKASLNKGMQTVLCVGESQEEYDQGKTHSVIKSQIVSVINELNDAQLSRLIIAYEPVWAIGTGKTATPEIAQSVHHFIRQVISEKCVSTSEKIMILYGGSVKPDNAVLLFQQPDIDGGLIGGASLNANDFISICRAI